MNAMVFHVGVLTTLEVGVVTGLMAYEFGAMHSAVGLSAIFGIYCIHCWHYSMEDTVQERYESSRQRGEWEGCGLTFKLRDCKILQ